MNQSCELLIVGASTRAAAASARRAGWLPHCVEAYGDRDLASIAIDVSVVGEADSQAIERLALNKPVLPWLYTGGVENHPELVASLSSRHRMLGNPASVLLQVRDPIRVASLLEASGIPGPRVRMESTGLPRDGSWLVKPWASAGGRGIEPLLDRSSPINERCYFQENIEGPSCSALFLASAQEVRLLGATRQLHGGPAGRFAYLGNIGPIQLSTSLASRLARLGEVIARGVELVGLFGVDFILRDDEPWLLEINPRYTASVEVLELATRRSIMAAHFRACGLEAVHGERFTKVSDSMPPARIVGKEVLYAERDLVAPVIEFREFSAVTPFDVPDVADVPWPGTRIARGEPILTVFANEPDESACAALLSEKVARMRRQIDSQVS